MRKIKLIDSLNNIDEKIVDDVLKIDSADKLEKVKYKEKYMKNNRIFKFGSLGLACAILVFGAVTYINYNNTTSNNGINALEQITNPLLELSNKEDMKKYLGYDVPVLNKDVETYLVINMDDDSYADHARIVYKDGSYFEMEKSKNNDISGINGSKEINESKIDNIIITTYEMEDTQYITWRNGDFSYSYSVEGKIDNKTIEEIVNLTK